MSVNNVGSFLNIRDSHLRVVSGNVYATAMNIGGINVDVAQGLQSVTNQGNVTSNTLQFSNATTAFVTTGNVSVGRDLTVTGNTLVSSNLTVTGNVLVSDDLTVTGNVLVSDDLTVTGNVAMDTDTLFVNATTSNVGIGTVTPGYTLDVAGDINFSGTFNQNGAPFVSSPWTKTGADLSYTTGNVSVGKDLTVTGFVGNSGTGAILVPSGTTAQQPAGVNGMLRYNSTTGYMEAYTVSGWVVIATPPSITSFDITNVAVVDVDTDTITVSGSGFDAITNIQLRGADGKNYDTTTFTFTNSGSIGFKIGTLVSGQAANRPFKVVATNGAGLSATSSTTLGLGGVTWSSPAASSINEFAIGAATTLTLSAYDGVGGSAVTYTLQSGSYLSGTFTLSGSTITGTTNAAENTTSSVTIRATDNADSSVFLDRTFTLKAVPDGLYAFSSHTFTRGNQTGAQLTGGTQQGDPGGFSKGPTFAQMKSAYASEIWELDTAWFNEISGKQGIQLWTVPESGTYRMTVLGARGGLCSDGNPNPGEGAHLVADFVFAKNLKLVIIVGQTGRTPNSRADADLNSGTGGGGASWVFKYTASPFATYTNDLYMVAGGGGGARHTSVAGGNAYGTSQGSIGGGGAGGTGGCGGGAGWTGDGTGTGTYGDHTGGFSPANGAKGGLPAEYSAYASEGGFGGGGGNGFGTTGGGGGGATGGRGSNSSNAAGLGGTSYIMPNGTGGVTVSNRTFSGNHGAAAGSVTIQLLP